MHKGMLTGLWSLKWVLLCLLLTGCPGTEKPPIPPPPPPSPEINVTGQVMLGPVVRGHSLQLVIYDANMKELIRPKIGLDGGYGFTLKDYEGAVIAQVTSTKPQQECSVGDYIDEATAKPKCLGNNTILSATVLKRDDDNNENQAKLHTTPVTTVAAISAGIGIRNDGTITVAEKLKETTITQSNKTIARALGLGDQSVAEYKPSSIITTNQKFQSCNAYCLALASLSGAEAEGQSLNDITRKISSNLNDEGKLGASIEDMMIRGIQKVAEKVQATSASTTDDKTILTNLSNYQYKFKNSKLSVDLTKTLPRQPKFINDNTTINREPTWEWESGGTGNKRYRYILKNYGSKDWTTSDESYFKQDTQLKPGNYTLLVQEGDRKDKDVWSKVSESTIEVVDLDKVKIGEGLITSKLLQGTLLRVDIGNIKDPNGVKKDSISYQWSLDGELINRNKGEFSLKQGQVGMNINVIVRYEDLLNNFHYIKSNISEKIKDVDDAPTGEVTIKPSNQLHRKILANTDNISDPDGIKSYSYQWSTGNSEIRGAVQKEFTLTDEEIGEQITVKVTIEDDLGNKTSFISKQTPKIKANGIPPTVKGAIEMGAQLKDGGFDINKTLSDANLISQFYNSSTPLTYVITALPSRGVIINNDGSEITKIENGEYQEVPKGFKYKRTQAGKDSFEYKGKRENILSLKPATINISYKNNAPYVSSFKISAAVETETRSIPFSENITDDQDAIESIIITDPPQLGSLYINGEILDASKLETLIDINSNVTYKSRDILNSSDSFKYKAIDTDDMRSFEGSVLIEFKNNDKAPKINKEPTQTDLMIDEAGKQISFKFKITDSSSFKAYEPLFLSTKGNTSQPLWISINTDKQSDSPVNYTVNATLNDKSYANDSIRVLIPVVDDLGLKSKYAFVINPELSVDTQNKFIQKNNTTWVDVCWQFSETTANLDSTKITEIKQEIMNTISDSWQKNSALKFDWREDDWEAIQDGKGQLFKWDSPSNCAENYTAEYAQVKVYIKQKEEVESKQAENRFTINLNVKADGSFEDAYPKHRIIHEFGHALGFPDENKRFDTFRSPSSQVSQFSCNDIMVVYNPKDENQNIAKNSVKKITHTKWQKQHFNSLSIMNECVFSNSEIMKHYDFGTLISGFKLGFNDINRLQYFYGAPATAETSHLMKADQFVTGLYLDANDYEYYENGIANSSYSPIEKSNLQTILSSNLHFSITNNVRSIGKTKTVLFKHEATTVDYPEFIPRETSPVAACEETGTNSQDENNQQKIQFDLNCDTIESVATHKQITEERSIYYKADSLLAIQMYYCKTKKEDTTTFKEQFTDKDVCLDLTDNFAVTLSTNNTHNLFSNGKKEFVFWLIETNQ